MATWLTSFDLAETAGISERKARAPLARSVLDPEYRWHGARLAVQIRHGRGGRCGEQYRVLVDSLPEPLQLAWRDQQPSLQGRLKHGVSASQTRDWRLAVIHPAIGKAGAHRAEAVRTIAARKHVTPDGECKRIPERTLYRWLDAYDRDGAAGLQRKARSDSYVDRTAVSLRWDRAVPLDDVVKHRIGDRLRKYIRGLRAKGTRPSVVAMLGAGKLAAWTREAGFDPGPELDALCEIPEHIIKAEKHFEAANTLRTDRKAHEDERLRHRRTRNFQPMDCIVGDVHPVDILCTRADGTTAHSRLIAWQDLATNRVWGTAVLLDKGKGITNAHVIQSFMDMVECWGVPRRLYLDNGSEYRCADFIDDALKLVDGQGHRLIRIDAIGTDDASGVKRTRPYAPQSKPIEGVFAQLEQLHFRHIDGWIGGNRMASKVANLGKAPVPFGGSFADLQALLKVAIEAYHVKPQGKTAALKGLSPRKAFEVAVTNGWRKTTIDPNALRIAFSEKIERDNRGGSVQVPRYGGGSETWTCAELREHHKAKVYVLKPKFEHWAGLPIFDYDDDRVFIGLALPQQRTDFFDPEGARLSDQYGADRRRGARQLARSVPPLDPMREIYEHVAAQAPEIEAPTGQHIGASDRAAAAIGRLSETSSDRARRIAHERDSEDAKTIARQEARSATLAKILANRASQNGEAS